jgi:hypothetical protein
MLSETERDSLSDILSTSTLQIPLRRGSTTSAFSRICGRFTPLRVASRLSRKLHAACLPKTKGRYPNIPWRKVSASGNVYRHDYEDVVHRLVWGTVHEFLPALRAMAKTELAEGG